MVAESKALKGEAAENDIKLQSLRQEVAALKVQYACACYPSLSSDNLIPRFHNVCGRQMLRQARRANVSKARLFFSLPTCPSAWCKNSDRKVAPRLRWVLVLVGEEMPCFVQLTQSLACTFIRMSSPNYIAFLRPAF